MMFDRRELVLLVSALLTIILCLSPRFRRSMIEKVPLLRLTTAAILIYTAAGVVVQLLFPQEITLW